MKRFKIPFKQDLWDKIHKDHEDAVVAFIGKRRKGKSITALGFCHSIDPEGFNADTLEERVFIHPLKFMEWIKQPKTVIYPGMALMFDEAGVGISQRTWYSFINQAVFKVMQIMGHKNIFLAITLPHLGYMDTGPRGLIDYIVEVLKIDQSRRMNVCKVKELYVDKVTGKYRTPFLRYKIDGVWYKYSKAYFFKAPPIKIVRAYQKLQETYKQEFEETIYLEAKKLHTEHIKKTIIKELDENKLVQDVLKQQIKYAKMRGGKFIVDQDLLTFNYRLTPKIAKRIKKATEYELNKDLLI